MSIISDLKTVSKAYEGMNSSNKLNTKNIIRIYTLLFHFQNRHQDKILGRGHWRVVYEIDSERVLKTVSPVYGLRKNINELLFTQAGGRHKFFTKPMRINLKEVEIFKQYGDVFPKIYESDPNGLWFIQDKVIPINNWDGIFEHFPKMKYLEERTGLSKEEILKELFYYTEGRKYIKLSDDYWEGYKSRIAEAIKFYYKDADNLFNTLVILHKKHKMALWDIKPGNVGETLEGRFVLLDSGFELT